MRRSAVEILPTSGLASGLSFRVRVCVYLTPPFVVRVRVYADQVSPCNGALSVRLLQHTRVTSALHFCRPYSSTGRFLHRATYLMKFSERGGLFIRGWTSFIAFGSEVSVGRLIEVTRAQVFLKSSMAVIDAPRRTSQTPGPGAIPVHPRTRRPSPRAERIRRGARDHDRTPVSAGRSVYCRRVPLFSSTQTAKKGVNEKKELNLTRPGLRSRRRSARC